MGFSKVALRDKFFKFCLIILNFLNVLYLSGRESLCKGKQIDFISL